MLYYIIYYYIINITILLYSNINLYIYMYIKPWTSKINQIQKRFYININRKEVFSYA